MIDLSADFRLKDSKKYKETYGENHKKPQLLEKSVYGLVEFYRKEIKKAQLIASPGCYPTSILLPLYPLLEKKLIKPENIVISSISGVSGAGKKEKRKYMFVERNESIQAYNIVNHRHLKEIEQELTKQVKKDEKVKIDFIPHLSPMSRGIHSTIVVDLAKKVGKKEIENHLNKYYKESHFVHILKNLENINSQIAVNTNFCYIYVEVNPETNKLIIISVIDNLLKGAAGQAIQAFNIMSGFDEETGLV